MNSARTGFIGRLRKRLLGLSLEEATFARRGFRECEAGVQQRLERIGCFFLQGYLTALEETDPERLASRLNQVEPEWCGFAFEGAAMGLYLLDTLTPWKRDRWRAFLTKAGDPHIYMVHVGAGWVLARLGRRVEPALARMDPLLGWLAIDGYGFHEGYFHWQRSIEGQAVPERLSGYACRVFDQGLGRSLWFVMGADVSRIAATITAFPVERRADLWSGVGLACTYAGGVEESSISALRESAGEFQPQLAQGAAFAAKARQRAGNPAVHTELACQVLCGLSADAAARITDVALENLPADGSEPSYEVWRRRIQNEFVMRNA